MSASAQKNKIKIFYKNVKLFVDIYIRGGIIIVGNPQRRKAMQEKLKVLEQQEKVLKKSVEELLNILVYSTLHNISNDVKEVHISLVEGYRGESNEYKTAYVSVGLHNSNESFSLFSFNFDVNSFRLSLANVGGRIEIREPLCRYTEEELYRQTALFKILIEWETLFVDLKRIVSAVLVSNEWKGLFEIKREVEELYSQIVNQEKQEEENYFNNLKPNQEFVRTGWEKARRTLFKITKVTPKRVYVYQRNQTQLEDGSWYNNYWDRGEAIYTKSDWYTRVKPHISELKDGE